MRTMNTEKLLKTIPIIQNQMDALLDFNVSLRWSPPPHRGSAARVVRSCSSGVCRVHRDCCISLIQKQTFCFLCVNKSLCRSFKDKCLGWLLSLRSMPTSWLMESSMQPSCCSSKTPSGSLLLIMKALSTCLVRPLRTHLVFVNPVLLLAITSKYNLFFFFLYITKQRNTLTWRRLSAKKVWTSTRSSSLEWPGYQNSWK